MKKINFDFKSLEFFLTCQESSVGKLLTPRKEPKRAHIVTQSPVQSEKHTLLTLMRHQSAVRRTRSVMFSDDDEGGLRPQNQEGALSEGREV